MGVGMEGLVRLGYFHCVAAPERVAPRSDLLAGLEPEYVHRSQSTEGYILVCVMVHPGVMFPAALRGCHNTAMTP